MFENIKRYVQEYLECQRERDFYKKNIKYEIERSKKI